MTNKLAGVFATVTVSLSLVSIACAQTQVVRESVPGITNFAHIETTVACAGAITPESVAQIREMGFASIINLRRATEEGANIEAEESAARDAGINFIHLPFGAPFEPEVADSFVEAIRRPENEPAFIHCSGGGRAATMWFIKRVIVDEWDVDRAMAEASDLGLRNEALRTFALNYIGSQPN